MTQLEQAEFVVSLGTSVIEGIVKRIKEEKVPENWDGLELREYLVECFQRETFKMRRTRKREYNNTILINNL